MGSLSPQDMSVNTVLSQSDGPTEVCGSFSLMVTLPRVLNGPEQGIDFPTEEDNRTRVCGHCWEIPKSTRHQVRRPRDLIRGTE
jgi:hypothetical protein